MKKIVATIFTLAAVTYPAIFPAGGVFAAPTTSVAATSEQKIRNKLNAEEARVAELNVALNPKSGLRRSLKRSSRGNDVKLLQKFLKVSGVYPEGLVTGYFGPLTEAAVKRFQEKQRIDPVGIAGPKTRARIFELSRVKLKERESRMASTTAEIASAVLSTAMAENGSATAQLTRFASTTENIYAALSLRNAKEDSQVSYIRYHDGSYVDSEVAHPSRSGLAYFHFQWSLKPGKSRIAGNYLLVFYLDGKKSKTINYVIY